MSTNKSPKISVIDLTSESLPKSVTEQLKLFAEGWVGSTCNHEADEECDLINTVKMFRLCQVLWDQYYKAVEDLEPERKAVAFLARGMLAGFAIADRVLIGSELPPFRVLMTAYLEAQCQRVGQERKDKEKLIESLTESITEALTSEIPKSNGGSNGNLEN